MIQGSYCTGRTIDLQSSIMGSPVISDNLGRTIVVQRGGTGGPSLTSSSFYSPGESLTISLSQFSYDVVYQATGLDLIIFSNQYFIF